MLKKCRREECRRCWMWRFTLFICRSSSSLRVMQICLKIKKILELEKSCMMRFHGLTNLERVIRLRLHQLWESHRYGLISFLKGADSASKMYSSISIIHKNTIDEISQISWHIRQIEFQGQLSEVSPIYLAFTSLQKEIVPEICLWHGFWSFCDWHVFIEGS